MFFTIFMHLALPVRIALSAYRCLFPSISADLHTPVSAPLTLQTLLSSSMVVNATSVLMTSKFASEAWTFLLSSRCRDPTICCSPAREHLIGTSNLIFPKPNFQFSFPKPACPPDFSNLVNKNSVLWVPQGQKLEVIPHPHPSHHKSHGLDLWNVFRNKLLLTPSSTSTSIQTTVFSHLEFCSACFHLCTYSLFST